MLKKFNAEIISNQEIQCIMPAIQAWVQSYSVDKFNDLHDNITVTQATLFPISWLELRTRYEARKLTNESHPYKSGSQYTKRTVNERNFPIWLYTIRDTSANIKEGNIPKPVKKKIIDSDIIYECNTCNAEGSLTCGQCNGHGSVTCNSCNGNQIVKCSSCGGNGQKKCSTCDGRGEKDCSHCTAGRRQDHSRCTYCMGRGFTRCDSCRDGFNNCNTCSSKGEVGCPKCSATGHLTCSNCRGRGEVICHTCEGSGKLINSFYITSSQNEKIDVKYIFPNDYINEVPNDVTDWIQNGIDVKNISSNSSDRFDRIPIEHNDQCLINEGSFLIDRSRDNIQWRSDNDTWDLHLFDNWTSKIIKQWYSENYIHLIKVEYKFKDNIYVLWCVAPCVTTTVPTTTENIYSRHFKVGTSVYASKSPIHEYIEDIFNNSKLFLTKGELKEANILIDAVLKSTPNDKEAIELKDKILYSQNISAFKGSLISLLFLLFIYSQLSKYKIIYSIDLWSILFWSIGGVLVSATTIAVSKIIYKTKKSATLIQFALTSIICFPLLFFIKNTENKIKTESAVAPQHLEDVDTHKIFNSAASNKIEVPAAAPAESIRIAPVADFSTCENPAYPNASQRNEETGTVILSFLVGVDGKVIDSKVLKSSGFRDLDRAAQSGISKCVMKPGSVDGKPEQSWMQMKYVWTLEDKSETTPVAGQNQPSQAIPAQDVKHVVTQDVAKVPISMSNHLTDGDLEGKSNWQLDIMRNEIFARHGRIFQRSDLQKYFASQSWYSPRFTNDNFPVSSLSDIERDNAIIIYNFQRHKFGTQ